jgi:hypothetical protein
LKCAIDEEPNTTLAELLERGVLPREEVYELSENIRHILKMDAAV